MDNNTNVNKNSGLLKLIFPIILVVVAIVGYFLYQAFFSDNNGSTNSASNIYLSGTKLAQDVDIINKENLSFTTNINNQTLKQGISISEDISPSQQVGRSNPFLP